MVTDAAPLARPPGRELADGPRAEHQDLRADVDAGPVLPEDDARERLDEGGLAEDTLLKR